jgi:hypothetical protein
MPRHGLGHGAEALLGLFQQLHPMGQRMAPPCTNLPRSTQKHRAPADRIDHLEEAARADKEANWLPAPKGADFSL